MKWSITESTNCQNRNIAEAKQAPRAQSEVITLLGCIVRTCIISDIIKSKLLTSLGENASNLTNN